MSVRFVAKSLFAFLCAAGFQAAAQTYPTKPIHIISPYAPGGSTDIVARVIAPRMSASLGQPVVVENRAGAGGTIGAEAVAHAAPDGYTLMITSSAIIAQMAFANRNLPYDPIRDFTPITAAVTQPGILLVNSSFAARTFAEVAAYAKAHPGKLSYATTGVGSSFHFMGEIVKQAAGIDLVHVPYKGGAQASQAIASGEVQLAFISNVSGMAAVRSGKARAIAILADKRAAAARFLRALRP